MAGNQDSLRNMKNFPIMRAIILSIFQDDIPEALDSTKELVMLCHFSYQAYGIIQNPVALF